MSPGALVSNPSSTMGYRAHDVPWLERKGGRLLFSGDAFGVVLCAWGDEALVLLSEAERAYWVDVGALCPQ